MPIYGYACSSCNHAFDALQKISEPKLVDCPQCGDATLRKQLSAPKFRLKGSGWYETDFKTGDKRNIAGDPTKKPESAPKTAETTKSAKKADSTSSKQDAKAKPA